MIRFISYLKQKTCSMARMKFIVWIFWIVVVIVPIYAAEDLSNEVCLTCHADIDVSKTVHEGKNCIDCHKDVKEIPHKTNPLPIDCTLCHTSMTETLGMDVHARARKKGNLKAPDCTTCHGAHNMPPRTSADSPMNPRNMRSFCITCHPNVPVPEAYHPEKKLKTMVCQSCHGEKESGMPYVNFKSYKNSIHKVLECADCHSDVEGVPHEDKLKEVDCGNCHQGAGELYGASIHGKAHKQGIAEAPQCWDCHGSHEVPRCETRSCVRSAATTRRSSSWPRRRRGASLARRP